MFTEWALLKVAPDIQMLADFTYLMEARLRAIGEQWSNGKLRNLKPDQVKQLIEARF